MARNPNWTRDELILALDLYLSEGRKQLEPTHPKVIQLSKLLNKLPIHAKGLRESEFRNPNGISMKLGNFLSLDPLYQGVGLSRGSKLEQEVWNEFATQPYQLSQVSKAIRKALSFLKEADPSYETGEEEFIEGQILARLHYQRERNPTLVKRKKESVRKNTGQLVCEVCNFDFEVVYGELGSGYAECHHLIPLAQLNEARKTRLADLAIVCSNCHRMLHKSPSMLTIAELRKIVQENRRGNDPTK